MASIEPHPPGSRIIPPTVLEEASSIEAIARRCLVFVRPRPLRPLSTKGVDMAYAAILFNEKQKPMTCREYLTGGEAKRLGHTVLDAVVENSALAFANENSALEWLIEDLHDSRVVGEELEPLREALEALRAFNKNESGDDFATKCVETLKTLPEGGRFLLHGGWTNGQCGHLMLYEWLKTADGYTVNIFNTADPTMPFGELMTACGKEFIRPVMSFEGVPLSVLLLGQEGSFTLSGEGFFQELLAFAHQDQGLSHQKSLSLIYNVLFKHLSPYRRYGVPADFATSQRGSTCCFSCLMAFLRYHMPFNDYKALVMRLKMREFYLAFNRVKDDLRGDNREQITTCHIFKKACTLLEYRLEKELSRPDPVIEVKELLAYLYKIRGTARLLQKIDPSAPTLTILPSPTAPSQAITLYRHSEEPLAPYLLPDEKKLFDQWCRMDEEDIVSIMHSSFELPYILADFALVTAYANVYECATHKGYLMGEYVQGLWELQLSLNGQKPFSVASRLANKLLLLVLRKPASFPPPQDSPLWFIKWMIATHDELSFHPQREEKVLPS